MSLERDITTVGDFIETLDEILTAPVFPNVVEPKGRIMRAPQKRADPTHLRKGRCLLRQVLISTSTAAGKEAGL